MNRYCKLYLTLLLGILFSAPTLAMAVEFVFHGDLNNRFGVYTDQQKFFTGGDQGGVIDKDNKQKNSFASIKYRFWTEMSTNDGAVKGVYAIELGAVRFGRGTDKDPDTDILGREWGGSFSGDGINIETRWAYTDFQIPSVDSKARVTIGLMPITVNKYVWDETATGVQLSGDNYKLAWVRGKEALVSSDGSWGDNNLDNLLARYEFKNDALKGGVFGLYQWQGTDKDSFAMASQKYQIKQLGKVEFDLITLGIDGSWSTPMDDKTFFVNWDLMYQDGSFDDVVFTDSVSGITAAQNDYDLSAYFIHADVGIKFGKNKVTYTGWYSSGDDDATDDDFDAFISTDVDRFDSIVLMEGGYTDDIYFTERADLFDKGFIMNKIAFDRQSTEKFKFGGAVMYMMTAEDMVFEDDKGNRQKEDAIGVEFDAYASYMLYPNLELAFNVGYLISDDAMDALTVDVDINGDPITGGSADDIWRSTARVRYKF